MLRYLLVLSTMATMPACMTETDKKIWSEFHEMVDKKDAEKEAVPPLQIAPEQPSPERPAPTP